MKSYLFNIVICFDLLASAITGGIPGETLSGRAGSARAEGKIRGRLFAPLIDLLFWNKDHCSTAMKNDVIRAQAVVKDGA